jgi:hypothetical protein
MEVKHNMENNLSWREAIIEVLKTSNTPMPAADIVAAIKERSLRNVTGNTPAATVAAQIYASIKREGASSPFVHSGPNEFGFKQPIKSAVEVPKQTGGVTSEVDEEEPPKSYGIIRAFGMYWRRDFVDWKSAPTILGSLSETAKTAKATEVQALDFCNQHGVYFLLDGSEVVYVGRAVDRPLGMRLHEHTFDRLNGRWDRFSWFGLLSLSENGKITDQGLNTITATVNDIIVMMEALLIEGLEPKQNRKRGDTGFKDIEYIQVEDPDFQKKRKKQILSEALEKM